MMHTGEDELFCDLAEVYGVLDPRALGVRRLAMLANGLPDDARVRRKQSGALAGMDTVLLACLVDMLGILCWHLGGAKVGQQPPSLSAQLLGIQEAPDAQDVYGFNSAADFEAARAQILKEADGHGDGIS